MKKLVLLTSAVIAVTGFLLLNSCQHEYKGDRCSANPIQLMLTATDATTGQNNGVITATAIGGEKFSYSLNGAPFQDSGYFTGLQPFLTYHVVVKNSWGCTDTAQAAINVTDPCSGVTVTVTATKTDALPGQNNGAITATASGGTGFTYSINGGAFQAAGTFTGLAIGSYTVTAKNSAGCTGTALVTIVTNDPCAGVTVAVTTTQVNPTGTSANGSVTATATGGSGFTYKLNNGAYQSSGTFTGLVAGNYTITAKNSNGCLGTATVALGATNPCAGVTVTVSLTKTDPSTGLNNGTITAVATGATGFTYSLNGGAYQTSGTFTGLAAGSYTITAKSSAGCLGSAQVTLVTVSPCASITITVTSVIVNNTPCVTPASGKITVTATGSTGFTYNLNGGAYQASNVFAALAAGNYTVGVKDVNGCTKTAIAAVANVAQGPLFAQMRTLISTRCNGSGCHMNGTTTAGYNFDNDCSIVTNWSQINRSCVLYTLAQMPKSPQPIFTAAKEQKFTNWINEGHRYTD